MSKRAISKLKPTPKSNTFSYPVANETKGFHQEPSREFHVSKVAGNSRSCAPQATVCSGPSISLRGPIGPTGAQGIPGTPGVPENAINLRLGPSNVTVSGIGSISAGNTISSSTITGTGDGSLIIGSTTTGSAIMSSVADGSIVFGLTNTDSEISNSVAGIGSLTGGFADNTSTMSSTNLGSVILGHCDAGAMDSSGPGSCIIGSAIDGGTMESSNNGTFVSGFTDDGSLVASGEGAAAFGWTGDDGENTASGDGSFVCGYADTLCNILASDSGSFAHGYTASSGIIRAVNEGCTAFGYSTGNTSIINAGGDGCTSFGYVSLGGDLNCGGIGSIVLGATQGGTITAAGIGSMATGWSATGSTISVTSSGGSIAGGRAITGTITCTGDGSFITGYMNGGSTMTVSGNGSAFVGHSALANDETDIGGDGSMGIGRSLTTAQDNNLIVGSYGTANASFVTGGDGTIAGAGSIQIANGAVGSIVPGDNDNICVMMGSVVSGAAGTGGGSATFWATDGADVAELYEWKDGNPNSENRIGHFVCLTAGGTIDFANGPKANTGLKTSAVIGVVGHKIHGTAGLISNTGGHKWASIGLRDEFGILQVEPSYTAALHALFVKYNVIVSSEIDIHIVANDRESLVGYCTSDEMLTEMESLTPTDVAKVNPDYNPSLSFKSRFIRDSWACVGQWGRVFVKDDGTSIPGDYVTCNKDGIATHDSKGEWFCCKRSMGMSGTDSAGEDVNVIQILFHMVR